MKNIAAVIIGLIGIWMIYLGITSGMLPPGLTGIGFILISAINLNFKK